MLREELLKKVRLIEIQTRRMIDDVLSGNYRSHFKGQGVQFSEHRLYVPGDDVRHIDWKVSARTRDPLVKKFDEERELTLFLVVDVSHSGTYGTSERLKSEATAEVAAMLAHAAVRSGDKVGALFFSDRVEKLIPPKKGRSHLLRLVRDILSFQTRGEGTDLTEALEQTARVMKHSGVVFVLSDFISPDFSKALKRLSKRHDVVAVKIEDGSEMDLPQLGSFYFLNPETGEESLIDPRSYRFKTWMKNEKAGRKTALAQLFQSSGVEELQIAARDDYATAVVKFFQKRAKRR